MEKIKAIGYIRISVKEELSLETQRKAIIRYCDSQNYELLGMYEDVDISGASLNRSGLLELLSSAKKDLYAQLFIEKELEVAGVELCSITEPDLNRNDPLIKPFREMTEAFARYEKEILRLRLARGRLRKYQDGGYAGGGIPLGYRSRKEGKEHSRLVIDEDEAKIVLYIKKLRRQKLSLRAIAEELNRRGYKTKRGSKWHPQSVKRILENPIYKGKIKYGGDITEGKHELIIRREDKG